MHYCIIGTQINALHAALLAIDAGHQVSLYFEEGNEKAFHDPTHGIFKVRNRDIIELLHGPLVDLAAPNQALFWDGQTHQTSLRKRRMLRSGGLGTEIFKDLQRTRLRLRFSNFTGDAKEERTMGNWLERRLGGVATKHIYEQYAAQRWGEGLDKLSNTLARHHFYLQQEGDYCAIGGTQASTYEMLLAKVHEQVNLINTLPSKIHRNDNGEWSLTTKLGSQNHDGPLLVCLSPKQVLQLFTVTKSAEVDLNSLQFKDLQLAKVLVEGHHNIHDLHIFDSSFPFYRVCFPYGQKEQAILHLNQGTHSDEALTLAFDRLGIGGVVSMKPIERVTLHNWTPIWTTGCLARHRRLMRYFESESIVFFGRQGLYTELTLSEELDYLDAIFKRPDVDTAEHQRVLLNPSPRIEDYNVEIGMVYR